PAASAGPPETASGPAAKTERITAPRQSALKALANPLLKLPTAFLLYPVLHTRGLPGQTISALRHREQARRLRCADALAAHERKYRSEKAPGDSASHRDGRAGSCLTQQGLRSTVTSELPEGMRPTRLTRSRR